MSFEAKYHSTCAECGGTVRPGELIESVGNGYRHVECPDDPAVSLRSSERVCSECFMVRPCEHDDERKATDREKPRYNTSLEDGAYRRYLAADASGDEDPWPVAYCEVVDAEGETLWSEV